MFHANASRNDVNKILERIYPDSGHAISAF
jgi:hypothetical protein